MYGYRHSNDNTLMTNLNSISSSLSSIDTIGRRTNVKASIDNLIASRTQSIASTSLLWKGDKADRYSAIKNATRRPGSDIYYDKGTTLKGFCFSSRTALNFMLIPLLLLTVARQVFDFMGQLWLQIIINFFTVILIIFALFGIKQNRISYLGSFILWALFNTIWNIIVICIHIKIRDIPITEDTLSFYTNSTSWWHSNGPGCLPRSLNAIQPSISIIPSNSIAGCKLDYHVVEAAQAALHSILSFLSLITCCALLINIRAHPSYPYKSQPKADKIFRLNNLMSDRSKVNQDPSPSHAGSRFMNDAGSLRRGAAKASSRSSRHSVSSARSVRRRVRRTTDEVAPTPRGSTSSMQRSQKYGSLSSRRSNRQRERRGDVSSLTYGATGERASTNQRTRLSSLSSVDYLPSYQPPHSSSANLLSSYGEISSIDSYNNRTGQRSSAHHQSSVKSIKGNTNPTYVGSRSSICSQNTNPNNYDDLSYIYGNGSSVKNSENLYGASSSNAADSSRQRHSSYRQTDSISRRTNPKSSRDHHTYGNQKIYHENHHQTDQKETYVNGDSIKHKVGIPNGSFHSFSASNNLHSFNYKENLDLKGQVNGHNSSTNGNNSYEAHSQNSDSPMTLSTVTNHSSQRMPMPHIYSNQVANGNSETPI